MFSVLLRAEIKLLGILKENSSVLNINTKHLNDNDFGYLHFELLLNLFKGFFFFLNFDFDHSFETCLYLMCFKFEVKKISSYFKNLA